MRILARAGWMAGFGAVAVAMATGCSSDPGDAFAKEPVAATAEAILVMPVAPNCRSADAVRTTAYAIVHSPGAGDGYTSPFPVASVTDPTIRAYEQSVWSIPRANGYTYLVKIPAHNSLDVRYVYLTGIRDRDAVPAYLMSPP